MQKQLRILLCDKLVARAAVGLLIVCGFQSPVTAQFTTAEQLAYYGNSSARNHNHEVSLSNSNFQGPPIDDDDFDFEFIRLTDDLNEGLVIGSAITISPTTGQVAVLSDFGDLHTFNIAFDSVSLDTSRRFRSFDVGAVAWVFKENSESADADQIAARQVTSVIDDYNGVTNCSRRISDSRPSTKAPANVPVVPLFTRYAPNRQTGGLGVVYGYREVAGSDHFGFNANGGILGKTSWNTETENWIVGPQVGLVGFKRFGRFSLYAHGLFVAGINDGEVSQESSIGEELIPGATNRLLYAQPTKSNYGQVYDEIIPMGVLWVEAGMQLTTNSSLKIAWSAMLLDNVLLSDDRTRYYLPDMGLLDPGKQQLEMQNFFCGIEMVR